MELRGFPGRRPPPTIIFHRRRGDHLRGDAPAPRDVHGRPGRGGQCRPPAVPGASTHEARLTAEQAFQKGMALLRAAQTVSAAIELRRACLLQPGSLEYALCASWAEARSRSEIPSEADRHTLLEIAQRAKKRDPMFAFGSYVLGQLAMWAGDDATAKKWFYEALRLDPASEAGQQVRILARRGAETLGPPSTVEPSHRDQPVEKAVEKAPIVAREPVPAAKAGAPSRVENSNPTRVGRMDAGGRSSGGGGGARDLWRREDIGARRGTRAEPVPRPRRSGSEGRVHVPGRRRGRDPSDLGGEERLPKTSSRTTMTRGRCDCLPARPGIASTWTAAASRATNPQPCDCPAAGTSSRLEAGGRRSRSMSVAEARFSYNTATRDEWRTGPTAEAIRNRARDRAHAIAADGSEP